LLREGQGGGSVEDLMRVLASLPRTREEAESEQWEKKSFAAVLLNEIGRDPGKRKLFDRLSDYVLRTFPGTPEKTRSCFEVGCTNLWCQFQEEPCSTLWSCGQTNVTPEWAIANRKVVILDQPILMHGMPARLSQAMAVILWQEACLRRRYGEGVPLCVWQDEAGQTIHPSHSMNISTVARSHGIVSVDIVQDRDVLIANLGGGAKAEREADAWMAQHMTKLFFACSNHSHNEWASNLFGKTLQQFFGGGEQINHDPDFVSELLGCHTMPTVHWNEHFEAEVQPVQFTRLQKGGIDNDYRVTAFLHQGGRVFPSGKTYSLVEFQQDF
jgi:hypothetical protein